MRTPAHALADDEPQTSATRAGASVQGRVDDGRLRECLDYNASAASSRYTIMIRLSERGERVARLATRVAEEWKPAGNAPQLIAEDWWKPRLPLHLRCHAR